jgi:L-Ala-D/L-Glu epimerase
MRLVSLDVLGVEIPLRRAFAHNLNTHRVARPQLVRATLSDGTVGWGEAQPRDYVTGETPESVRAAVAHAARDWRDVAVDGLESAAALLRASPLRESDPAAFAGIELAILDAAGRLEGRSVATLLGGTFTDTLSYDGAVLGFLPMPVLGMALARVKALGKSLLKLKAGRDDDALRIAAALSSASPASHPIASMPSNSPSPATTSKASPECVRPPSSSPTSRSVR